MPHKSLSNLGLSISKPTNQVFPLVCGMLGAIGIWDYIGVILGIYFPQ